MNPKFLYTLICITKRREQVTTLPNCNCRHPPLETWYLCCLREKIIMISCFCFATFIYVNKLLPTWQSVFNVKARNETQSYSCTVSHSANSNIWNCLDRGSSVSARIHEQKSLNLSKWLNPTFLPFPLLFHTLCMSDKLSGKYSLFDISLLNAFLVQ